MIFPYWQVQRGAQTRLLPLVPVRLGGKNTALDVLALVDSGAEHSVFGMDLAERLGIPAEKGTPVSLISLGGTPEAGYLTTVRLQLGKDTWTAPAIFSVAANEHAILGQAGFFAFFTVTFRYHQREVEIRRAR